jgi:hypothetical protein
MVGILYTTFNLLYLELVVFWIELTESFVGIKKYIYNKKWIGPNVIQLFTALI